MNRLFAAVCLAASCLGSAAYAQQGSAVPTRMNAQAAPLNLNTATAAQLEELPGIGARTAERIVEYRQKNGGFKKIEDLMNVRGVGEKSFLKLKPLITVGTNRGERAQ